MGVGAKKFDGPGVPDLGTLKDPSDEADALEQDSKSGQARLLGFLAKALSSQRPIPMKEEIKKWGWSERSFRRIRNAINKAWKTETGRILIKTVDADGLEKKSGGQHIAVAKDTTAASTVNQMATLQAFQCFLNPILQGTLLNSWLDEARRAGEKALHKDERACLARSKFKFHTVPHGVRLAKTNNTVLEPILNALLQERTLEIKYVRRGDTLLTTILVQPLTLVLFGGGLYLACQVFRQGAMGKFRNFKLESIKSAKVLWESGFVFPNGYNPAKQWNGTFGFIKSDKEELVTIEVNIDSWRFNWLKERQWSKDDKWETRPQSNGARLTIIVSNLDEALSWVMQMGPEARVISPPKLVTMVRESATKMLEIYRKAER